jgi:hypothetical protein
MQVVKLKLRYAEETKTALLSTRTFFLLAIWRETALAAGTPTETYPQMARLPVENLRSRTAVRALSPESSLPASTRMRCQNGSKPPCGHLWFPKTRSS